ncbi:MAG TPA: hypothetical protein VK188_06430, partial [Holophaga sp.]|nr:hypothetical protein [Holophaga sp.]
MRRIPGDPASTAPAFGLAGLLLALLFLACGGGSASIKGTYHPKGWLGAHPAKALANLEQCRTCHEMTVLKVGSAIPNCMTAACHHGTIPGFSLAASHGLRAKAARDASGGGLASCQT